MPAAKRLMPCAGSYVPAIDVTRGWQHGGMAISVADFLGLEAAPECGSTWRMPVDGRLLNSAGTLWGGVGLSAFVAAAELVVERRCMWATVQYLTPIRAGAELCIEIDVGGQGIALTQASGRGMVEGEPALLAIGTFGGDGPNDVQFSGPPDIPRPEECEERSMPHPWGGGMLELIEQRTLPKITIPNPNNILKTNHTIL